jgi:hypothetical protein
LENQSEKPIKKINPRSEAKRTPFRFSFPLSLLILLGGKRKRKIHQKKSPRSGHISGVWGLLPPFKISREAIPFIYLYN